MKKKAKKRMGRPPKKNPYSIVKNIRINKEILAQLEEIREREGDDSVNSLIRRILLEGIRKRTS